MSRIVRRARKMGFAKKGKTLWLITASQRAKKKKKKTRRWVFFHFCRLDYGQWECGWLRDNANTTMIMIGKEVIVAKENEKAIILYLLRVVMAFINTNRVVVKIRFWSWHEALIKKMKGIIWERWWRGHTLARWRSERRSLHVERCWGWRA